MKRVIRRRPRRSSSNGGGDVRGAVSYRWMRKQLLCDPSLWTLIIAAVPTGVSRFSVLYSCVNNGGCNETRTWLGFLSRCSEMSHEWSNILIGCSIFIYVRCLLVRMQTEKKKKNRHGFILASDGGEYQWVTWLKHWQLDSLVSNKLNYWEFLLLLLLLLLFSKCSISISVVICFVILRLISFKKPDFRMTNSYAAVGDWIHRRKLLVCVTQ